MNTETARAKLLVTDRCDRCMAQAFLSAIKDGSELLFCGHHATDNVAALKEAGFTIHDERRALDKYVVSTVVAPQ